MLFKMFFLTTAVLLTSANAKFYTDCGSTAAIEWVGVSGCKDNAKFCTLKRNNNATISIDFVPTTDVNSINTEVHATVFSITTEFTDLPHPDACRDNGITCPLKAGEKVNYRTSLFITETFLPVRVSVKWQLKGDNDEDLVCIVISAKTK